MTDLPVKGLDETLAVLSAFPEKMQKQAVRRGMTRAAAVVRDEARFRAPRKTGGFAKKIKSGSPRKHRDGTFSVSVRVNDPRGYWFEYGVSPHYIEAGTSNLSARKLTQSARREGSTDIASGELVINGNVISGAVLHPGFSPKPFLRVALDTKSEEAVRALAFEIEEFVYNSTGFQSAA